MKKNLNTHVLVILIALFSFNSFGQSRPADEIARQELVRHKRKLDSLELSLKLAKDDTTRINIYELLADECDIKDNPKYALPLIKAVDDVLPRIRDEKLKSALLRRKALAYKIMAVYYADLGNTDSLLGKRLDCTIKALEIYKQIRDSARITGAYLDISQHYFYKGEILKQLETLKEGLAYTQKMGHKVSVGRFLLSIGRVYSHIGDTVRALEYIQKTKDYALKNLDSSYLPKIFYSTAGSYSFVRQYDTALKYYNIARTLYKKKNDQAGLNLTCKEMGIVFMEQSRFDSALYYYQKSLEISGNLNDLKNMYLNMIYIGQVYAKQNKIREAIIQHEKCFKLVEHYSSGGGVALALANLAQDHFQAENYAEAKKYAERAFMISTEQLAVEDIIQRETLLYRIDSAMGNYKEAYFHYHHFLKLKAEQNAEDIKNNAAKEKFQADLREQELKARAEQEKKDALNAEEKQKQNIIILSVGICLMLALVFAGFIFKSLRTTRRQKEIIEIKNKETEQQKHVIEEKQQEILDSITYAKRLQEAILPPREFISTYVPDNFVLYKPKDLVAGDFYWAEYIQDKFYIAAADSTGHGVPGAMVSVVCSNALNRTIKEFKETQTGRVLDKTRELVLETFEKSESEVKDGMDISLLCIDKKHRKVSWSGANNPLWYFQNNELKEITANKQPIGKTEDPKPFTTHEIEYAEGTTFYLFTDGLADQFGGPKGKKFKYKQFAELLQEIISEDPKTQAQQINKVFEDWKGSLEQVDDVCVIGIRI